MHTVERHSMSNKENMKQVTINVPDSTKLLQVLAVIDKETEIHYTAKFCDLRDGKTEWNIGLEEERGGDAKCRL